MLLLVFLIRLVKAVQESRELPSVKAQVEQASVAQTVFFGRRPFPLKSRGPEGGVRATLLPTSHDSLIERHVRLPHPSVRGYSCSFGNVAIFAHGHRGSIGQAPNGAKQG